MGSGERRESLVLSSPRVSHRRADCFSRRVASHGARRCRRARYDKRVNADSFDEIVKHSPEFLIRGSVGRLYGRWYRTTSRCLNVSERLIRRLPAQDRRRPPVAIDNSRSNVARGEDNAGSATTLHDPCFCRTPCWVLNVPRASLRNSLFRRVSRAGEGGRGREMDRKGSAKLRRATASPARKKERSSNRDSSGDSTTREKRRLE